MSVASAAWLEQPLPSRKVTVAATQFAVRADSFEANVAEAEKLVEEAAALGANIILIQELFEAPYFCQEQRLDLFQLAAPVGPEHPLLRRFALLSRRLGVVLPVSFFERAGAAYYNSLVVFDADGTCLGLYRKSHIPDGPGYQEKFYFNPGDTGFRTWKTRFGTIGVGICWDQWFPECARAMALQGAEILFYPTAIGSEPQDDGLDSRHHWRRVMQGHAGANLCPVIASNRIGGELTNNFYGTSFIADQTGAVVAEADDCSRAILVHTFDLGAIQGQRQGWGVFRDRRPELYTSLLTLDGLNPTPAAVASVVAASNSREGLQQTHHMTADISRLNAWLEKQPLEARADERKADAEEQQQAMAPKTPYEDGFVAPAEWEPQARVWLGWPTRPDNWRDQAAPAQAAWTQLVQEIAKRQPVGLLVPGSHYAGVADRFEGVRNVRVFEVAQDDAWLRDTGPIWVVRKNPADNTGDSRDDVRGVDYQFNAWGGVEEGCYPSWEQDQLVPRKVLAITGQPRYSCPLILEGGAVLSDGQGTVITTEECLLNPNRSVDGKTVRDRAELERMLRDFMGAEKVIWVPQGVYGDEDTNGHIDNILSYVGPARVALAWTDDPEDPQYERSQAAMKVLEQETDARGRKFAVHKLPMPKRPIFRAPEEVQGLAVVDGGHIQRPAEVRLPASYANMLLGNGAVYLPVFGDENDAAAIEAVKAAVGPEREVVPILGGREILLGGGNVHCITQQEPMARRQRV